MNRAESPLTPSSRGRASSWSTTYYTDVWTCALFARSRRTYRNLDRPTIVTSDWLWSNRDNRSPRLSSTCNWRSVRSVQWQSVDVWATTDCYSWCSHRRTPMYSPDSPPRASAVALQWKRSCRVKQQLIDDAYRIERPFVGNGCP